MNIEELVDIIGGKIAKGDNVDITGVESLKNAKVGDISFLANKKYATQVAQSKASAVIVGNDFDLKNAGDSTIIVINEPNGCFSKAINFFAPPEIVFPPNTHPAAVVANSANIGENTHIGACAVIGENVTIGKNCIIDAGVVIGNEVTIGDNTLLYANVSIRERAILGSNIIIHSGTVIGSDGFGYEAGINGIAKIPQVGIVQIDNDVEIGSNCSIDRARFGKTWLKTGVKLDNQVHVAHNVEVGEYSMLIGQCGIAGSTVIGQGVIVAAKAGINGHITLGDGSIIGGTSGVVKDVAPGDTVIGTPAESKRDFMTRLVLPKSVNKLKQKIKLLEKRLTDLEK